MKTALYVATVARGHTAGQSTIIWKDPGLYESNMDWYRDQIVAAPLPAKQFTTGFSSVSRMSPLRFMTTILM